MKNIEFTRINNDVNGNPRYVTHFLNLVTDADRETLHNLKIYSINNSLFYTMELYKLALKRAKQLGGRKYHTKAFGGGIVFQSYNIERLKEQINELVK